MGVASSTPDASYPTVGRYRHYRSDRILRGCEYDCLSESQVPSGTFSGKNPSPVSLSALRQTCILLAKKIPLACHFLPLPNPISIALDTDKPNLTCSTLTSAITHLISSAGVQLEMSAL
jgi:hypothetical protein